MVAVSPLDHPRKSNLMVFNEDSLSINEAILEIDNWLDSQRSIGGYSGPVVHWWEDSLGYQGPGLDWRYEGIIIGYLNLWRSSGNIFWLQKAKRAGDDLLAGQLPSGNYRNSRFEFNPGTGGTPHEAACDLALLKLAEVLRDFGDPVWHEYRDAAYWNIQDFYIQYLWAPDEAIFVDNPNYPSFVPNKAATLVEALFAMARICKDDQWIQKYALPTLDKIIDYQLKAGKFEGAFYQSGIAGRRIGKFFPFYISRCIPGLLLGYQWTGQASFAEAAIKAGQFLIRFRYDDGSFPQVIYSDAKINRYPQWVAGLGDILRVMDLLIPLGMKYESRSTLNFLLAGRRDGGGICTAKGFGKITPFGRRNGFKDELCVCGWVDKAFRYLSGLINLPTYELRTSRIKS